MRLSLKKVGSFFCLMGSISCISGYASQTIMLNQPRSTSSSGNVGGGARSYIEDNTGKAREERPVIQQPTISARKLERDGDGRIVSARLGNQSFSLMLDRISIGVYGINAPIRGSGNLTGKLIQGNGVFSFKGSVAGGPLNLSITLLPGGSMKLVDLGSGSAVTYTQSQVSDFAINGFLAARWDVSTNVDENSGGAFLVSNPLDDAISGAVAVVAVAVATISGSIPVSNERLAG